MDASRFEKCIGKLEESPEVSQLLKELGVTKKLKPARDEDTQLGLPKLGLDLGFSREQPESSQLTLIGVEFLTDDGDGGKAYTGGLPRGLAFTDSKQDVYAKLGPPSIPTDESMRMDHWLYDGLQLTVSYARSLEELMSVQVALPYEKDDDDE